MRRIPINPMIAIGLLSVLTSSAAMGKPRIVTKERREREAKLSELEEWNRAVDKRKAAKKTAKKTGKDQP